MRLVGLHRDTATNRAYLQFQAHPGHPFESIELSIWQLLTLAADAAAMAQTIYEDPAPPQIFVAAED